MSATKRNNRALVLLAALLLLTAGAVLLSSSRSPVAEWLVRLWPVFLICAGIVRLMGFAAERKPRSPLGGTLLIIIGLLLFANRLHPSLNVAQVYGRYWVFLLVIFAAVELVRYYSHPKMSCPPPKLFTTGKIIVVLLILSTGVLANRAANNSSLASALRLPGFLSGLRDSVVGEVYTFTDDPFVSTDFSGDVTVSVENSYGNVRIVGGRAAIRATLSKGVRAWNRDDAQKISERVKLIVNRTPERFAISTNRDQFDEQFTTDIQIEVPFETAAIVNDSYGSVSIKGISGPVQIKASYGEAELSDIQANSSLSLNYCSITAARIEGDVIIKGAKSARLSELAGTLDLTASNGTVELRRISGRVHVEAPYCRVTARGLANGGDLNTEHGSVDVEETADLSIEGPFSDVKVRNVTGDLSVGSSHGNIDLHSITGELEIKSEQSAVSADDIGGHVAITTSHGSVQLRSFYQGASVETSFRDVVLAPAGELGGDVDVRNTHGEIKLLLPNQSAFELDAESENGMVRQIGFAELPQRARESLTAYRGVGPLVKLRTSYKNIIIQANGARQAQAG